MMAIQRVQRVLQPGELAVVRVPIAVLDVEAFRRLRWRRSIGLDVGQSADLRCMLRDGSCLHLHVFFDGAVPYIEAHIDATDPLRDAALHAVEATEIVPGAILGGLLALLTGMWLPAIVLTAAGASIASQRRRVVVLGYDEAGLPTVLPAHRPRALLPGRW